MQLTGCTATEVETQFRADHNMKRVDTEYLHELLTGIDHYRDSLTDLITPELDRGFEELDPIERAILYIGCFELVHRIDIPYKVSINEAVELTKMFGASDGYKLINSVLDNMARILRPHEFSQRRNQ